jgi:imidazole glycerol phosphate synthase glutamine amidotransferase subunit
MEVRIVKTGTANMASVAAALARLGCIARIAESLSDVQDAARLVLPGVGTLSAAMQGLASSGFADALRQRIDSGRPTLGICLGMQVLCEGSEESPGVKGLGLIPGIVRHFPEGLRVPQLGWNSVAAEPETKILGSGYAYFANSYRLVDAPPGWKVARCEYGGEFIAAVERGAVVGCQFHPELSGEFGLGIIKRWLDASMAFQTGTFARSLC